MTEKTQTVLTRSIEIAVIVAVLVVSAFYIHFRYFKEASLRPPQLLSPELINYIDVGFNAVGAANGVQVISVDLNKNIRYIVYARWDTPELLKLYKKFSDNQITTEIPVFVKGDIAQNMRIIRLMNHQFECSPFNQTLIYKLSPGAADHIATVCSISIPPAFAEFKGIVSVSLSKEPTDAEKEAIREILTDMSNMIYKELHAKK